MSEQGDEVQPITDRDEHVLRQVHPSLLTPAGEIMKTAFAPSDRDAGLLSTVHGRVAPAEAYRRWTQDKGLESIGTFGLEVGEVLDLSLGVLDDSAVVEPDHVSIDFRQVPSKGRVLQLGRKLRDAAVARGCLHGPGDEGSAA